MSTVVGPIKACTAEVIYGKTLHAYLGVLIMLQMNYCEIYICVVLVTN